MDFDHGSKNIEDVNSVHNGKRKNEVNNTAELMEVSASVGVSLSKIANEMKTKKMKLEKSHKTKKCRVQKAPVWSENTYPTQVLYDVRPNLEFFFSVETKDMCKVKYLCKVNVESDLNDEDSPSVEIIGDGLSKKEAKRKCAFFALCYLFPDSYQPSQDIINSYNKEYSIRKNSAGEEIEVTDPLAKLVDDTRKRIKKFVTKVSVQTKTATQLLNELCPQLAETGKLVSENGTALDQKFTYEFRNIFIDATSSPLKDSDSLVAYGFGRSKKDAKQHAARQALKQFLDCDVDKIA